MLDKMIDKIKRDFLQKGGIIEQMYRARTSSKYYQSNHTYQSYQSNPTPHSSADTPNNSNASDKWWVACRSIPLISITPQYTWVAIYGSWWSNIDLIFFHADASMVRK